MVLGPSTSSSHALIGGYAGAAVAKSGFSALIISGRTKTLLFIVLSPLIGLSVQGLEPYSLTRAERILFGTSVGETIEIEVLQDGQIRKVMLDVVEDPYTKALREARERRPLG